MSNKQSYTVKSDGWVAGQHYKAGATVEMTKEAAKYETNLILTADLGPRAETAGSVDDPLVKPGPAKRGRARK